MIKLIACDLDGTLLNEEHLLDQETKQMIARVKAAGIEFMVATGRSYESVMELFHHKSLHCEYLVLNGALVTDADGHTIMSSPMSVEQVRCVIEVLKNADLCYHLYTDQGTVVTDAARSRREFREHLLRQGQPAARIDVMMSDNSFFQYTRELKDDTEAYLHEQPVVYKMETHGGMDGTLDDVREQLQRISDIEITNSIADNIEITNAKAQKGYALLQLCKLQHLEPDEVMTIGDSMNDLSMMKMFRNSVAMKNAIPAIKEAATYQSLKTNAEGGVSDILQRLLNGEWPPHI